MGSDKAGIRQRKADCRFVLVPISRVTSEPKFLGLSQFQSSVIRLFTWDWIILLHFIVRKATDDRLLRKPHTPLFLIL